MERKILIQKRVLFSNFPHSKRGIFESDLKLSKSGHEKTALQGFNQNLVGFKYVGSILDFVSEKKAKLVV